MPQASPLTAAGCALALLPGLASATCTEDAMLVFDASGSMAEMGFNGLDRPRIHEARAALHDVLPNVTPLRRLGLVVYGPGASEACSHVQLHLPPTPDAAAPILATIDGTEPDGNTALTEAVNRAIAAFEPPGAPGTVVVVTDGKETCGGATCTLAARLAAEAPDLTVHVIGFRVRGTFFGWEGTDTNPEPEPVESVARCLADQTGGLYLGTESTDQLIAALNQTLGCPMFSALVPGRRD
ncbi:MAG: VWA domain-containing protein [Pseudomonadota bacterium]